MIVSMVLVNMLNNTIGVDSVSEDGKLSSDCDENVDSISDSVSKIHSRQIAENTL